MKSNYVLVVLLSLYSAMVISQEATPVVDLSTQITTRQSFENKVISTADVQVAGESY